jgi:hypothetical protein
LKNEKDPEKQKIIMVKLEQEIKVKINTVSRAKPGIFPGVPLFYCVSIDIATTRLCERIS